MCYAAYTWSDLPTGQAPSAFPMEKFRARSLSKTLFLLEIPTVYTRHKTDKIRHESVWKYPRGIRGLSFKIFKRPRDGMQQFRRI